MTDTLDDSRTPITFIRDDGGRAAAGIRGTGPDCVVRAFAIVTGRPYTEVAAIVTEEALRERPRGRKRRSTPRSGVHKATCRRVASRLGLVWTPTMGIGSGCTVHVRADELPAGRLVLSLSKHLAAFVDGVLRDLDDCSRGGTRCVYGYWSVP